MPETALDMTEITSIHHDKPASFHRILSTPLWVNFETFSEEDVHIMNLVSDRVRKNVQKDLHNVDSYKRLKTTYGNRFKTLQYLHPHEDTFIRILRENVDKFFAHNSIEHTSYKNPSDYAVGDMWLNHYTDGSCIERHHHGITKNYLSGSMCLYSEPDKNTEIELLFPGEYVADAGYANNWFQPLNQNTICIWPATLSHQIKKVNGERVIMSFNIHYPYMNAYQIGSV